MGELFPAQQFNMNDLERMATAIAKSGLFGMKTAEQALALMLLSHAEGLHPATAARDYHIIQGRPALKADAILARFQQAGGRVEWLEYNDNRVVGRFIHPQGGSVEVDWTLERAKSAGLGGKDNWKSYPRQMLRARVISEGVRTVYPAVLAGMYTPEEVMDMESPAIPPGMTRQGVQAQADLDGVIEAETVEPVKPPQTTPAWAVLPQPEAAEEPPEPTNRGKTSGEVIAMIRAMQEQGLRDKDKDLMLAICSNIVGREVASRKDLTPEEAIRIRKILLAVTASGGVHNIGNYQDFWNAYLGGALQGDLNDIPALVGDYAKLLAVAAG